MALVDLITSDRGTLAYRIEIEGHAYTYVTDRRITAASILDGREVVVGLLFDGLQLGDTVRMAEGRLETSGITFRICPEYTLPRPGDTFADPLTQSLSVYPESIGQLDVELSESDTTMSIEGGGTLEDGVYHIASEAIRVSTWPNIERHIWGTAEQRHPLEAHDHSRVVHVYAATPTLEGRRVTLYAYSDGSGTEDYDGAGQQIWIGYVQRQPRLTGSNDLLVWSLECAGVSQAFRQSVAARLSETFPQALYHHSLCAFGVRIFYDGTWGDRRYITGVHDDLGLTDAVNLVLADELANTGADATIDLIELSRNAEGGWRLVATAGAGEVSFAVVVGSPLCGFIWSGAFNGSPWTADDAVNTKVWGDVDVPAANGFFEANTTYRIALSFEERYFADSNAQQIAADNHARTTINPLGPTSELLSVRMHMGGILFLRHFEDLASAHSPWRIYTNDSLSFANHVHIPGAARFTGAERIENDFHPIAATGIDSITFNGFASDLNWIEIDPITSSAGSDRFAAFLYEDTPITPVRRLGTGSVADFMAGMKIAALDVNIGDVPSITDADVVPWVLAGTALTIPQLLSRQYVFLREKVLEEILAEELKYAGHMMRVDTEGRIELIPIPSFTEAHPVETTHRITSDSIITPAEDYGSWPTFEPQADGIVTTVQIREGYNPVEDDWAGAPNTFVDDDAISRLRMRGKRQVEIKPFSRARIPNALEILPIAQLYLGLFSANYIHVEVDVTWQHLTVLCGDIVSYTYRDTPDGTGSRGLVERRAVVVGRRWNLDPARPEMGRLTLRMLANPERGYTPSALITGQADNGSNNWSLTCSVIDPLNIEWSTQHDGLCLQHFIDGDYVSAVEQDSDEPITYPGRIVGTPDADAGTCVVLFDGVFDPAAGTGVYALEFQHPGEGLNAQENQLDKWVYVADASLQIGSGTRNARKFAA